MIRLIPLDPHMKPHLVQSITATMTGVLYGQVMTAAAQAVLAAKDYLKLMPFSCRGLINQLSSSAGDKFTVAQATYGAHQTTAC